MRRARVATPLSLLPLLPLLPLAGCWLGHPYEPMQFCFETEVPSENVDGVRVYRHAGKMTSHSWNDAWEDPVGRCGEEGSGLDLPEHVIEIKDDPGDRRTRFGYSIPELEIPEEMEEGVRVTLVVLQRDDPESWAFIVYGGDCEDPASGTCRVEIVADDGVGGTLVDPAWVDPLTVQLGAKVARRNGDCGKLDLYELVFKGGGQSAVVTPGSFDVIEVEEEDGMIDYFAVNVDSYIWDIDECGDAMDRTSYALMRGE